MAVTLSFVVLLGGLIFFLVRLNYLRWARLCSALFQLVAGTGVVAVVQAVLSALGNALGPLHA